MADLHQSNGQDNNPDSAQSHEQLVENYVSELVEIVRGDETIADFKSHLAQGSYELSTFKQYRLMEVIILSDRSLAEKHDLLQEVGVYVTKLAEPFKEFTPHSPESEAKYLATVQQIRGVLKMCSVMQDGVKWIEGQNTEEDRKAGLAGLQDQVRAGYMQRGIPVEPRDGYTDLGIEGRNFLNP